MVGLKDFGLHYRFLKEILNLFIRKTLSTYTISSLGCVCVPNRYFATRKRVPVYLCSPNTIFFFESNYIIVCHVILLCYCGARISLDSAARGPGPGTRRRRRLKTKRLKTKSIAARRVSLVWYPSLYGSISTPPYIHPSVA